MEEAARRLPIRSLDVSVRLRGARAQGATLQSDRAKRGPTAFDSDRRSPFQKVASEWRCIRAERVCTHFPTIRRDGARERHFPSIAQVRMECPTRRREE